MSSQLLVRPAARADLRESFTWYEEQRAGLGAEFLDAVERKLTQIELHPMRFPVVRNATRRAIVLRFPYSVFYVVDGEMISVHAVMHHARSPVHWLSRS